MVINVESSVSVPLDDGDSTVYVYFLSGALAFTTILSVLLAVLLYIIRRRTCCQCRGKWYSFFLFFLLLFNY